MKTPKDDKIKTTKKTGKNAPDFLSEGEMQQIRAMIDQRLDPDRMTVHDIVQPKEKTRWGYDTMARFIRVNGLSHARRIADNMRQSGWFVDATYPNRYDGNIWDVVGIMPIYPTETKMSAG